MERALVTARRLRSSPPSTTDHWTVPPRMTLEELEREAIKATLERTQGNMKAAATELGIDRSTLYDKLKRYEIER